MFDQAARFAARADPQAVVRWVLALVGVSLAFREWLDTRSFPLPGGPDRIADLVAALDGVEGPTLLVIEFQAQHDPDKLDVTLEEAAILRARVRYGKEHKGKYRVVTVLVYLQGHCPEAVLDMTLPGGFGTRHAPLIWNVGADSASGTLEAVAARKSSWGLLFWVPLMAEGKEEVVINRWKEVVGQVMSDRRIRGDLAAVALLFAELVGRRVEWKRGLEGLEMTESQVVNEWISQGVTKGGLEARRQDLLVVLGGRFPGTVPTAVVELIQQQDSLQLLHDWLEQAVRVKTMKQFLKVLKK